MFKKITILVLFFFSFQAQADLIGGFGVLGEGSFADFSILSHFRKDHLSLNFYIDARNNQRYRQVGFSMGVDHFLSTFHSDEEVSISFIDFTGEIKVNATGTQENRTIVIESLFRDDGKSLVAQKEVVTLKITENLASMQIEAFRRKRFLGVQGRLTSVSSKKVRDLVVDRSGVGLFGMNSDNRIGRVTTEEGLKKATQETSTQALVEACEVDCS